MVRYGCFICALLADRNPDELVWKHLKRHGRAHDGDEQGRLQKQGPLVNAAVAK